MKGGEGRGEEEEMRKQGDEGKKQGGEGKLMGVLERHRSMDPNFQTVVAPMAIPLTCADDYLHEDCHRTKTLNCYWLSCHLE